MAVLRENTPEPSGRVRVVRIPPYGDVNLSQSSTKVINSKVIQRLRYIRQSGISLLDFPNAIHTRFEHVLGTHWNFMKIFENNKSVFGNQYEKYATQYSLLALSHHLFEPAFSYATKDAVTAIWKKKWKEFDNMADQIIADFLEPIKDNKELSNMDLNVEGLSKIIKHNLTGGTPKEPLFNFIDLPFGPGKIDSNLRDCYSLGFGEALGAQELINNFRLQHAVSYDLSGKIDTYFPSLNMTLGNLALLNGSIQANKTVAYRFFFSNPRRARNKLLSRLVYKYLLDDNLQYVLEFDKFLMFVDDIIYHELKNWVREECKEFEYIFSNFCVESQKIYIKKSPFSEIEKLYGDYDSLVKMENDIENEIEQQMNTSYKVLIDLRNFSKDTYWGFDKYRLMGIDEMESQKYKNVVELQKLLTLEDKLNRAKSNEREESSQEGLLYIHICSKDKIEEKSRLFKIIEKFVEVKLKIQTEPEQINFKKFGE